MKSLSLSPIIPSDMIEQKWRDIRESLMLAEEKIGQGWEKQPDWFIKAEEVLQPLLKQENAAHNRYLCSGSKLVKNEFQ